MRFRLHRPSGYRVTHGPPRAAPRSLPPGRPAAAAPHSAAPPAPPGAPRRGARRRGGAAAAAAAAAAAWWRRARLRLLWGLDHPVAAWCLIAASLFVVVQEDLKYAALPPGADLGMEGTTLALLCTFVVELGERGAQRSRAPGGALNPDRGTSPCHGVRRGGQAPPAPKP
jgi:hypothetical protein